MKIRFCFLLLLPVFMLASCNKDEGIGGSSSLEGYVYKVMHQDDNFSFRKDTFPAVREDVYLIFGDREDDFYGEDVKTDQNGLYRFDYLRKGDYIVYACSDFVDGHKVGETKNVTVHKGLNRADTIFIHGGKAYGTAMIQGTIHATYYHNGDYRDEGPGVGVRVYIRHAGEIASFDDIRAGENGVFIFQKLLPGDYVISVETEDRNTEKVDVVNSGVIRIGETGKIYIIPETFRVSVSV
ncbi:MAG: hypothetical protein LBS79_06340 [Tannerella sp.]|jgi:hypothetical protein|nr:hypothetical protein [Tannerella sp.]